MSQNENSTFIEYQYIIQMNNSSEKKFIVRINKFNHVVFEDDIKSDFKNLPDWTKLSFHQCSHCPYNSQQKTHCPVAANISHVVDTFKEEKSFLKANVIVYSRDRRYEKETDLQTALQSLLGLIMAGSDCEHMNFLKGLVTTHLPFSNIHETTIRIFGYYLQQALKNLDTKQMNLEQHSEIIRHKYQQLTQLNQHMISRISSVTTQGESIQNAIVILNVFSALIPLENLINI